MDGVAAAVESTLAATVQIQRLVFHNFPQVGFYTFDCLLDSVVNEFVPDPILAHVLVLVLVLVLGRSGTSECSCPLDLAGRRIQNGSVIFAFLFFVGAV